jgi:stage III sporulation protein AA
MYVDPNVSQILPAIPPDLRAILSRLPLDISGKILEIRLRTGRPVMILTWDSDGFLGADGKISDRPEDGRIFSAEEASKTLQLMAQGSIYALEEELRRGYITLSGGHRVGLVGRAILEGGRVRALKHISGFNIRIAREVKGAADRVIEGLIDPKGAPYHTLIVSPPGCGKTTLLRDIARQLSDGIPRLGIRGMKVGIVDERSEIAGCYNGVAQKDIGIRTDVLDACPKAEGIMILIRSMSPQVILADEIGSKGDMKAILEAVNAGVKVITSVHAWDMGELLQRPYLSQLVMQGTFQRILILGRGHGPGTVEAILDGGMISRERS